MTKLLPSMLFALLAAATRAAAAFDYASYQPADIDELIEQSRGYTPEETEGQTLFTSPRKVRLVAELHAYPWPCPDLLPHTLLKTIGVAEPPPMARCMQLRSSGGGVVLLWIQESIAEFVEEEYALGDPIEVRALWLFVNGSDKKPYFVVNGIGPGNEPVDPGVIDRG